jgi:hypothetical protein
MRRKNEANFRRVWQTGVVFYFGSPDPGWFVGDMVD